jgi:lysophospholipase L1-like esterase
MRIDFKIACLVGIVNHYKCVNEVPRYPYRCMVRSTNPLLHSELEPGCNVVFDGYSVKLPETHLKINSYGFRDYEYALNKENKTFRIIALGDSFTFGWGVELNESYPKILEKMLNEMLAPKTGIKYEVLNFGVPGYNALEKVVFFKKLGIKFNPDLIIFQYGADDIGNVTELNQVVRRIFLNYAKQNGIAEDKINHYIKVSLEKDARQIYFRELKQEKFKEALKVVQHSLEDLGNITNHSNISVLLFTPYDDEKQLELFNFKEQKKSLEEIAKRYKWSTLFGIMPKYFQKYKWWDLILHPQDPHPSALSYKLIAEEIYKKLLKEKLIPN